MKSLLRSLLVNNQGGAVSLITAGLVSILLTIVTIGMITLTVGELRQSVNFENSAIAYNAAEAGAENAVAAISTAIATDNAAPIPPPYSTSNLYQLDTAGCTTMSVGSAQITCSKITTRSNAPSGALQREEPVQFNLVGPSSNNLKSVEVDWNQSNCTSGNETCNDAAVPTQFGYGNGLLGSPVYTSPAVMEVTAAYTDASHAPQINTTVLTPYVPASASGCSPHSCVASVPNGFTTPSSISPTSGLVNPVECFSNVVSLDYNCKAVITGFDTNSGAAGGYVIRIRPRYAGTHYRLQFCTDKPAAGDSCASPISVPLQFASIDVTAKSGNVYRRVVEQVEVRSIAAPGLDYVLYSDTQLCKDFTVDSSGHVQGTCSAFSPPQAQVSIALNGLQGSDTTTVAANSPATLSCPAGQQSGSVTCMSTTDVNGNGSVTIADRTGYTISSVTSPNDAGASCTNAPGSSWTCSNLTFQAGGPVDQLIVNFSKPATLVIHALSLPSGQSSTANVPSSASCTDSSGVVTNQLTSAKPDLTCVKDGGINGTLSFSGPPNYSVSLSGSSCSGSTCSLNIGNNNPPATVNATYAVNAVTSTINVVLSDVCSNPRGCQRSTWAIDISPAGATMNCVASSGLSNANTGTLSGVVSGATVGCSQSGTLNLTMTMSASDGTGVVLTDPGVPGITCSSSTCTLTNYSNSNAITVQGTFN